MGSLGFHKGANWSLHGSTLDIIPSHLEECIDGSQTPTPCIPEDKNGGNIIVYSPIAGEVLWTDQSHVVNIGIDMQNLTWSDIGNQNGGEDIVAARELYLEHIIPDASIVEGHQVMPGDRLGILDTTENPRHLAFQIRFYKKGVSPPIVYQIEEFELLGILTATGTCVIDDWNYNTKQQWKPDDSNIDKRVQGC